ncbi:hypothetical protein SynBOUM118_01521 [Synechococcus sp. BOUM118]|nr:hypothetical protein SynBOUM118_01521 [Synechococcus sp. BOUM118]
MGSGRRGGGSRIGFVSSAFDWAVDVDLNSFTTGLMGMAVMGLFQQCPPPCTPNTAAMATK